MRHYKISRSFSNSLKPCPSKDSSPRLPKRAVNSPFPFIRGQTKRLNFLLVVATPGSPVADRYAGDKDNLAAAKFVNFSRRSGELGKASNTVTHSGGLSFYRRARGWRGSAAQRREAGKNSGALNANKGSNFGGDSKSREVASEWKRKTGGLYMVKASLEGSSHRGRIRINHPRCA